jgi:hypothetical protein
LSGAINIPASVSYNGAIYVLKASTAAVQTIVPTNATFWVSANEFKRLPIFSAAAAVATAASNFETLENSMLSTGLTSTVNRLCFGNSLFLADCGFNSQANIATSPDGITWTLRAMPSTSSWAISTNGSDQFIGTILAGTTVARSINGTTWTAATSLPAANKSTQGEPCFNGSRCLVMSNTAATAYTTTDNAVTWGTQTLPANCNSVPFGIGGLFWYWSSTTTAYTSPTGATGSWTLRTLPLNPVGGLYQDTDGSIWITANATGVYHRSIDGINWTLQTIVSPTGFNNNGTMRNINGALVNISNSFGFAFSYHSSQWVPRRSLVQDSVAGYMRAAKNPGNTVWLIPHNTGSAGLVGRIAPNESNSVIGTFV